MAGNHPPPTSNKHHARRSRATKPLLLRFLVLFLPFFVFANAPYTPGWGISVGNFSHDFAEVTWNDDPCSTDAWVPQIFRNGKVETLATVFWTSNSFRYTGLESETDYQFRAMHQGAPYYFPDKI